MAVYVIGDVQGCFTPLQTLLDRISFNASRDLLWFTGDLVDRGPQSLEVLRFVRSLDETAVVVLGNHDLHLLAVTAGIARTRPHNTFQSILSAPDRRELVDWLSKRPLLHHDETLGLTLIHAGLLPQWELEDAGRLAREAEDAIANCAETFFPNLFGDFPDSWEENLNTTSRWRVIVNALTRLRYCDIKGHMALRHNESPVSKPQQLLPWFDLPDRRSKASKIIFGHWSTLGLCKGDDFISLDSGCGWGGNLTAARVDVSPMQFFAVAGPKSGLQKSRTGITFPVPNPEEATYLTTRIQRIIPKMLY